MWVKKLRDMLAVKLTHVDFYNKEFLQYSVSSPNTNKSILEIKFYSNQIAKYIRIILKNYSDSKLIEDFVKYFKTINNINTDEINNFFRKKVVRVLNKNASVLGSDINPNEAKNQNYIKVPYLNKECMKRYTLVLDLDETLICYKINPVDDHQGILRFRPYLDEFLDIVSKYYELVIILPLHDFLQAQNTFNRTDRGSAKLQYFHTLISDIYCYAIFLFKTAKVIIIVLVHNISGIKKRIYDYNIPYKSGQIFVQ